MYSSRGGKAPRSDFPPLIFMAKSPAIRALAARFPSFSERCYVRGKLSSDPLYPAVHAVLAGTSAPLLDIGCGMGLLAYYLRACGWQGNITGLDYDPRKIATAKALATPPLRNLVFHHADAMAGLPDHHGSVTILDILQYFPVDARASLLRAAAARVAPDGLLVIRTGLVDSGWRFQVTRAMDHFASLAAWMKSPPTQYPRKEEIESLLAAAGLQGSLQPLWGRTPFNNWLGVFRRQGHPDLLGGVRQPTSTDSIVNS